MVSTEEKTDPIGDEFYRPLVRADQWTTALFYAAAALSIAALLVQEQAYPTFYAIVKMLFALAVIALFASTLFTKLYFSPRAQLRRYQDFLSHAFGRQLSYKRTTAYYNNSAVAVPIRIAAQVCESSFFSREILARMVKRERIIIAIYVIIWVIAVLNRNTNLAVIGIAAQIVFSEQIISRWLRLEWLLRECERMYDDLFRLLQSKSDIEIFAIENLGRYEIVKATAAISLSSRIFDAQREHLNAEWEKIRKVLEI
jgi:hypothetical protein